MSQGYVQKVFSSDPMGCKGAQKQTDPPTKFIKFIHLSF